MITAVTHQRAAAATRRVAAAIILALTVVAFLLAGLDRVNKGVDPGFEDTGSYLEGALLIKENGGLSSFVGQCLSGRFTVESQQPLYLLLLSPFASRDLAFFPKAQLVSLAVGLLGVLALFFVARDLFDAPVAMIAAVLLALNLTFLERSSVVACETLLILLVLLAWYFMVKGVGQRQYWMYAGVASGLAYMTKATGLVTIPLFVLFSLTVLRSNALKTKHFWSFFVLFAIAASPLLARNIVVYGSPFYAGVNSNAVWVDDYRDLADPKYELLVSWPDHTYSGRDLPTLGTYLSSHSVRDILQRGLRGLAGEWKLLFESTQMMVPPRGQSYWSLLALVLFIVGLSTDRDRARRIGTVLTILAFFGPAAWYFQIIPDVRFITPVIPLLCLYCAVGALAAMAWAEPKVPRVYATLRPFQMMPYALATVLIVVCAYYAALQVSRPLLHSVQLSDDQAELFAWLRDNVDRGDIVSMGPTNHYWGYMWYANFQGSLLPSPANVKMAQDSVDALTTYLRARGVTVVVVHGENYRSPDVLAEHFAYDRAAGLVERKPVPGWKLVYEDSKKPTAFRIYGL